MPVAPVFSIIVLNFNSKELTIQCVESILAMENCPPYEIVILDNGSHEDETVYLKNFKRKNIRILRSHINLGFDQGNNYAASFSQGKYLLFLNNDTLVENNLLVEAVKILDHDESIGMASPIICYYPSLDIQYAGGQFRNFRLIPERHHRSYSSALRGIITDYPSGCALFLRRSVLRRYPDIFDPRNFFTGEEIDLSYRIKEDGYKIVCFFSSKVLHRTSKSSARKIHLYYMIRNRFLYIAKYVPSKKIVPAVFFALLYASLFLKFLPRQGISGFFTIKDAIQDGISSLQNIRLEGSNVKVFCRQYVPHLANVSQFRN